MIGLGKARTEDTIAPNFFRIVSLVRGKRQDKSIRKENKNILCPEKKVSLLDLNEKG